MAYTTCQSPRSNSHEGELLSAEELRYMQQLWLEDESGQDGMEIVHLPFFLLPWLVCGLLISVILRLGVQ